MKPLRCLIATFFSALLGACAAPAMTDQPQVSFHDTRLQYALVSGDDAGLAQGFGMKLPASWPERVVAGMVLPFTAVTEAVFFPVATGIRTLAPAADYPHSP